MVQAEPVKRGGWKSAGEEEPALVRGSLPSLKMKKVPHSRFGYGYGVR